MSLNFYPAHNKQADKTRGSLAESLSKSTISYESVTNASKAYIPQINQVLAACKVQPDAARLDERLHFEWKSGVETSKLATTFKSEALMYELVMTVACEALGTAGMGCDSSVAGEFTSAGKHFKGAAGIWQYLGQDLLPKWISRGSSVDQKELPVEATPGVADALTILYLACAQQMIVSTALAKNSKPSYSLMAKLTLGIAEQIDDAVKLFRTKAGEQMQRIDATFFTLLAFQAQYQRALSSYFLARAAWDEREYGVAIALLHEATVALRTRDSSTGNGLPDVESKASPLRVLGKDLTVVRIHMNTVLQSWEKDNSTVYFDKVPQKIPQNKKLQNGMKMIKEPDLYSVADAEAMPLSMVQLW